MDEFEIGYLMGLVVREGSFTGDTEEPCLTVKLHADDPEPLERLQAGLGGKIYGPYCHSGRRARVWVLRGYELFNALPLIDARLPQSKKRRQFEGWLVKYGLTSLARSPFWIRLSAAARGKGLVPRESTQPYRVDRRQADSTVGTLA